MLLLNADLLTSESEGSQLLGDAETHRSTFSVGSPSIYCQRTAARVRSKQFQLHQPEGFTARCDDKTLLSDPGLQVSAQRKGFSGYFSEIFDILMALFKNEYRYFHFRM